MFGVTKDAIKVNIIVDVFLYGIVESVSTVGLIISTKMMVPPKTPFL
jgi:hypothetical protein